MNIIEQCIQQAKADLNIEILWLYGSQAKNTATDESDFDFAVAFKTMKKDSLEQRLMPELLAQQWADQLGVDDKKISVVDINHIPLALGYGIISTGQVLLCKNPLRLAKEENRISGMWADYQLMEKYNG